MRVSHPSPRSLKRRDEHNVIQKKMERARHAKTYKCARCHLGPLRDDGSTRAKARLCKADWYELHNILRCNCDAIRGEPDGVYLCDTCPVYTGTYAKGLRADALVQLDHEH